MQGNSGYTGSPKFWNRGGLMKRGSPKTLYKSSQLVSGDKEPWLGGMDEDLPLETLVSGQHIAFIGDWQLRTGYRPTIRKSE